MRQIEFRGLYKNTFVYGNLICGEAGGEAFTQIERSIMEDYAKYDVAPETVGQYTGLKDKEGTKIFEGDRVKGWINDPDKTFTVAYHASKYSCEFVATDNDQCNPHVKLWYEGFEVIGNIHDK